MAQTVEGADKQERIIKAFNEFMDLQRRIEWMLVKYESMTKGDEATEKERDVIFRKEMRQVLQEALAIKGNLNAVGVELPELPPFLLEYLND